jgi:hypothetical protein
MKNRNGKKEKQGNHPKNPNTAVMSGVTTAVRPSGVATATRPGNPSVGNRQPNSPGMQKPMGPGTKPPMGPGGKAPAGPAINHTEAARAAQEAIQKDPANPENYAALAGALRMLAQFLRTRNPEGADNLCNMACAAAWEAKRRSTPALTSGRTKQEVKILTAWLRTKNHLTPEASDGMMDTIHSEYLSKAIDGTTPLPLVTGLP